MRAKTPRWGRSLLIPAALFLSISHLSCGRPSASRVDQGREVAIKFLDELRAGRVDPAWQGTTVEFKSLMGSDSLRDYVRTHPALKTSAEFVATSPIETGSGQRIDYQFRATLPPARGKARAEPSPKIIRVMISLAEDPPRVERLTSE